MFTPHPPSTLRPAPAALAGLRAWWGLLGLLVALLLGGSLATPVQASPVAVSVTTTVGVTMAVTAGVSASVEAAEAKDNTPQGKAVQTADPDDLESDLHGFSACSSAPVFARCPLRASSADSEFLSSPLRRPPRGPRAAPQA